MASANWQKDKIINNCESARLQHAWSVINDCKIVTSKVRMSEHFVIQYLHLQSQPCQMRLFVVFVTHYGRWTYTLNRLSTRILFIVYLLYFGLYSVALKYIN